MWKWFCLIFVIFCALLVVLHAFQGNEEEEDIKAPNSMLEELQSSNWTSIQRRQDGSVNFYRNWAEYKEGFGDAPNGEFFLGLQKIHEFTSQTPQELLIVLKDWDNNTRFALYDHFEIGNESEFYSLKNLGKYQGNAGDDLNSYKGMKFSTYDSDNDIDESSNCAELFDGAWWFTDCGLGNVNGPYLKGDDVNKDDGVTWDAWKGAYYSLQFSEMKLRPKQ
ncbi:fibrinogen C domain-containing protein 1-like [Stomoxys calcitrans]|uniref:fibrinogen C domain-containing protein 1-like n=1 Tax=Stomoxys calcitrans TaxID=35570 RepID=UPI0027E327C5|nr:fibrinogen C domain-containing protein 1-like [Stomoxys calcitrans]